MYTIKVDKNELEQNGFSMEEIAGIYIFSNEYEGGEFRADMEEGKRAGYQVRYDGINMLKVYIKYQMEY